MTSNPLSPSHRHLPKSLRAFLEPLIQRAQQAHLSLYLVGGCVRDLLLGALPKDVDVVIEGSAMPLAKAVAHGYKAKLVSHPQFLTHTLLLSKGHHLDIAAARTETYIESAALPTVEPASLQEDLYRRDFSINAMALSLNSADFGHVWDPFGGLVDLEHKRIRVLHSESFKDDPTRVFRAARFAGRLGYRLDWRTREWLMECVAEQIPARLSGARLREELVPILMEKDPRPAFRWLAQWNALSFLIPNLRWEKSHDLFFGHILKSKPSGDPLVLRLLVLLHALPFPKAIGSLGHLMFPQKMIDQLEQTLLLLVRLRQGTLTLENAKATGSRKDAPETAIFLNTAFQVRAIFPKKEPMIQWRHYQDSTPCLSGRDLRELGYKPGPLYSRMIDALRQARWEGKLRTREEEIRFLTHAFPLNGG